jgi:hypothetical protein
LADAPVLFPCTVGGFAAGLTSELAAGFGPVLAAGFVVFELAAFGVTALVFAGDAVLAFDAELAAPAGRAPLSSFGLLTTF